jgi:hypothetical protein
LATALESGVSAGGGAIAVPWSGAIESEKITG